MLVITRKHDESITIADNIEITVLEISKDKVKIGINAPKDISIYRSELLQTLRQTNEQSAKPSEQAIQQLINSHKQEEN